jgi:signal transduction histidine kinase
MRVPAGVLGERAIDWFPLGSHLIAGLVRDIRTIDSITRQREALVALGTLAAGLAHEMNNPASAATRAVAALEKAAQSLVSSQGRLAKQLSTSQLSALDDLRRETRPSTAPSDALELSDREEDLSVWLNEHGVDGDWEIAPPLAAAGLDARWCERVSGVLDGASLGPSFEWIAASLATTSLVSEVKDSTTRISDLVAAVRSYSQLDRASLQQMDLVEGLESTLVMLGHKLRGGITIERDYAADVPPIEAIAGELNQVWTNVIDNAVDAMNGSGTLRISTRNEGESVSVEIRDTGEGMSEDARAHAFDPFFTTKDIGKGTGLGLDISRRIVVDRHGGEITIDSQPGETIVRVRLPVAHKK